MLLAIDPGACSGWALFTTASGMLVGCGLDDPTKHRWYSLPSIERVVIERPRIYPRGLTKNPNDIVTLALNAGEWAGRYKPHGIKVEYVYPSEWKGQTDKAISHTRTLSALTADELLIVPPEGKLGLPKSKRHNLLDAIGLGLFSLRNVRGSK